MSGRAGLGIQLCQEGLNCEGGNAEFFCQECGTHQCLQCESLLHSTRELKLHSRKRLSGCRKPCELWCNPKNIVCVFCQQCSMNMCADCDSKMHQGRRKEHVRLELTGKSPRTDSSTPHREGKNSRPPPTQTSFLLVNDKEDIMVRLYFLTGWVRVQMVTCLSRVFWGLECCRQCWWCLLSTTSVLLKSH